MEVRVIGLCDVRLVMWASKHSRYKEPHSVSPGDLLSYQYICFRPPVVIFSACLLSIHMAYCAT